MIESTKEFLTKLEEANIDFCVWKNLHQKNEILNAKTDVDLYIPLEFMSEFRDLVFSHNGIEVFSRRIQFLVINHYYLPLAAGEILHLHVYHRLYTGASHVKEFNLPIGDILISKRIRDPELGYIPSREVDNWLTIIRYYLKKSSIIGALLYLRERKRLIYKTNVISTLGCCSYQFYKD